MSRLAKKPVILPAGVGVSKDGSFLVFKGARGELKLKLGRGISAKIEDGKIFLEKEKGVAGNSAELGTFWSLAKNCAQGVAEGFSKILEMEGVGYKAAIEGRDLVLSLGYAEPVRMKIPEGATVEVEKNVIIKISGTDKDLVGRVAAQIRALKKPEPYKGKGIKYRGEVIRRKVGKKAGATAAA